MSGATAATIAAFVTGSSGYWVSSGNNAAGQQFSLITSGTTITENIGTGARAFTTTSSTSTNSTLLVISLAAGAQISAAVGRQTGVALSESSVASGTTTLNIVNTAFSIGSRVNDASYATGGGCLWMIWDEQITGAALTAVEYFGAVLSTLD
jgi:hypothetical protein